MNSETQFIYTDASYDKTQNIAVVGCVQTTGKDPLEFSGLSDQVMHFEFISEANNIRSEIRAVLMGLQFCKSRTKILLFTDCEAVVNLTQRREQLEKQSFVSQRTGFALSHADLYKEFYAMIDRLEVKIQWVKGHSSNQCIDTVQTNFSYLDRQVRKKLRKKISEIKDEKKIFHFNVPNKRPDRQVDSIRHEINKYLSREMRKPVPENADFWGFDCKIGENPDQAQVIHVEEISSKITDLASRELKSFYLEILAKPEKRQRKEKSGS